MLNRRFLRIKAMQAIYGFSKCREANFHLAIDRIAERFLPDLNSMEVQDMTLLAQQRAQATQLFKQYYQQQSVSHTEVMQVLPEVKKAVIDAIDFYYRQIKKDKDVAEKAMLREAEKIYDRYLLCLKLLVDLSDFVDKEAHEKQRRQIVPTPIFEHELKFFINKTVGKIRKHQLFNAETAKRNLHWDSELVRQWYKLLQKDEIYREYQHLTEASPEKDAEIADYILRNFIFKHEQVVEHFALQDIYWDDNKNIVKSLATKSLKNIIEAEHEEAILMELSPNWDDDRYFFELLFQYTLDNEDEYEKIVVDKVQNWDVERFSSVDRILLKMAIAEMLHFPSIPVKVTINEFIDISKTYSTPRSREFVNGLLDAISADLQKQGLIRKSGRGLLDNK